MRSAQSIHEAINVVSPMLNGHRELAANIVKRIAPILTDDLEDECDRLRAFAEWVLVGGPPVDPDVAAAARKALGVETTTPERRPRWLGPDQYWPCGRCGREVIRDELHDCRPAPHA